ncbi:MAG: 50S ribosomal protein L11 methyltransferase, partial [Rhizobiales bacterium]|nr:50S ribosomal protein L11 methyltransferase [Hyphomicrobiales bacterium]
MPASAVLRLDGPEAPLRRLADTLGEILDIETTPIGVFESDGAWRLSVYCADAAAGEDMRALVADIAGAELGAQLRVEPLAERDWVAASLAGLSPVVAGRYFVHGAHDRARAPRNAVAIELEAALAFGTGHHGTTRGCLLALDAVLRARPPRRVLDVGTGTGILAIAAALSTRRIVMAGDIDPRSVTAARGNARANGVGAFVRVSVTRGVANRDFVLRGPYDLV